MSSRALRWRFRIERVVAGDGSGGDAVGVGLGNLCADGEMVVVFAEGDPSRCELHSAPVPPEALAALAPFAEPGVAAPAAGENRCQ